MLKILVFIILAACTHTQPLDVQKTYKKTLRFRVNGEVAEGIYSAKKNTRYRLEISVPQKPSFVKVTSCHQEKIFVKPGKEIEFDYRPNPDIEAGDLPCLVEISALEESGKNQWGLIDFQLAGEELPAEVACNGVVVKTKGSHICQSRAGLIQAVTFDVEVSSHAPEACATIEPSQGKKFYFPINEGNCFYIFADATGKLYRLVTFGYTEVLLDYD